MTKLSTGQVRTLSAIAAATDRESPFYAPKGPSGRPAKFLKAAELITDRGVNGQLWITDAGRLELERQKGGAPA